MDNKKTETISSAFLILFIFFSLLLPIYFAQFGSPYYPEFSFANLFVGLFILSFFYSRKINMQYKKFALWLFSLLIIYNIAALYININYLKWLWEEFNVSLAILFFLVLLLYGNKIFLIDNNIIKFIIGIAIASTIIGIIVYFLGYASVSFINGIPTLVPHDPNYYEKRFNWLYFHKSQYCLMLLFFMGLLFSYKKHFKTNVVFWSSNIILIIGILISHTYTALFASCFILGGYFIDYLRPRIKKINKVYFLSLIPIAAVLIYFVNKMGQERNIWSLGGRTYIWNESVHLILNNPLGVGNGFGTFSFPVPGLNFEVYNCHNVFLNEMYRFSLPVGLIFTIFFISVIVYSLKRNFSFLNLGIWIAVLISLCMDYSLLAKDLTIVMFLIYCIFFLPIHTAKNQEVKLPFAHK